jgi:quinol monooxygenase YgiN
MAPVLAVFEFPANPGYIADPSILNPALDILASRKGAMGVYHGIQVEDSTTGYMLTMWEDIQDHLSMTTEPIYAKIGECLGQVLGGEPQAPFHLHLEPAVSVAGIMNANFIVLAKKVTLQEGKTEADLLAEISVVAQVTGIQGMHGQALGKKVENPNEFSFITGWESVEDHIASRQHPELSKFLAALTNVIKDIEPIHIRMIAHKRL